MGRNSMTSAASVSSKARKTMTTPYQMYIGGQFVEGAKGRSFEVFDPATENAIATCPAGDASDVNRAVQAARTAFYEGWRNVTAQERGRILFRLAERIRARRAELAELETRNSGKPIVESEYDMDDTATCFEYYGGLATKINGEVLPVPAEAVAFAMREPVGVAGQIIPWNYPLLMAAWKVAPAIAAGCTVVLKPAEQTPLSILALAREFEAIGLPPGVVNIVTGDGPSAGAPQPTSSSGSRWNWGASRPTSSSATPTSRTPSTELSLGPSSIRARCAPPAAEYWCSGTFTRSSLRLPPPRPGRFGWETAWTE